MGRSAIIIGNGSAGLLLALGLKEKGLDVSIIYRRLESDEDSALICPQLVIDLLGQLVPSALDHLRSSGARLLSHTDLLRMKFPDRRFPPSHENSFLFLSRKLFLEELSFSARALGIKFFATEVTGLSVTDDEVTGVETSSGTMKADLVFDCSGGFRGRQSWLKDAATPETIRYTGVEEDIFQRFYQSTAPVPLFIRSIPGCRGGIYPVEGNRFVLNLSSPAGTHSLDSIAAFASGFVSFIGGADILKRSEPEGGWKKLTKKSYKTDYYESPETQLKNFFPLGEGVLCSHPVYGRGISLAVLQMTPLLEAISSDTNLHEISAVLSDGFGSAEKKWREVSGERNSTVAHFIKRRTLTLLEEDPVAYEQYLSFYQLQRSSLRLFLGLLMSPLRLRKKRSSTSS